MYIKYFQNLHIKIINDYKFNNQPAYENLHKQQQQQQQQLSGFENIKKIIIIK